MARHTTLTFDAPATDEQIARVAPSVFTLAPHASRSDRFAQITTADILRGLRGEGWGVFSAGQTKAKEDKREHTKHMLRLRRLDTTPGGFSDGTPELVLINAHDGTSAYKMMGGYFRIACLNGLIAGDICQTVRVGHTGPAVDRVVRGSFEVLDGLTRVVESRDTMRGITLDREEQRLLAESAVQTVWGDKSPVEPLRLLSARRWDDRKPDLWTTFNTIQENIVRGGVRGTASTGRALRTRGVAAIDKNVSVNRALWTLAEGMAALKQGKPVTAPALVDLVEA